SSPDGKLLLSPEPFARVRGRGVPLPPQTPWPRGPELQAQAASVALPVPADSLFTVPADAPAAFRVAPTRGAVADTEEDRPKRVSRGRGSSKHADRGRGGRARFAHAAPSRRGGHAAPGGAKPATHAAASPRRPVRVASLKKR